MSSIPLRPIHKLGTRRVNGYSPLTDTESEGRVPQNTMNATGAISHKAKGKRRVRYNDEQAADESENVGLLANEGDSGGELDQEWKEVCMQSCDMSTAPLILI
jgi:hypothetical protein